MGSGSWSSNAYDFYYVNNDLKSRSINEVFNNNDISVSNTINSLNKSARLYNNNISVHQENVGVRECRDSEEHPNTTPIIVAFDVTGSMGHIPHKMVTELLPKLMNQLKEIGVPDPELLFMGIGDHLYDRAPIQITQFESDTEKICSSLQSLYLEGGGGGNRVESYLLAWIAAGYHTETDSWYNRHKKGFLFTIGDEVIIGDHTNSTTAQIIGLVAFDVEKNELIRNGNLNVENWGLSSEEYVEEITKKRHIDKENLKLAYCVRCGEEIKWVSPEIGQITLFKPYIAKKKEEDIHELS